MSDSDACQARWPVALGVAFWLAGMLFPVWWWHPGTLADAMNQPSNQEVGVTSAVWPNEVTNRLRTYALPDGIEDEARGLLARHNRQPGGRWTQAPVHTLRGVFAPPPVDGQARLLLVFSSLGSGGGAYCHACAPTISFFEFEKNDALPLQLVRFSMGDVQLGSWGGIPPFHVLDWKLGQTAVFFVLTDGAQGSTTHELRGFGWVQGQLEEVLFEVVGETPQDVTDGDQAWQTAWMVERTQEGFLCICLKSHVGRLLGVRINPCADCCLSRYGPC